MNLNTVAIYSSIYNTRKCRYSCKLPLYFYSIGPSLSLFLWIAWVAVILLLNVAFFHFQSAKRRHTINTLTEKLTRIKVAWIVLLKEKKDIV